MPNRPRRGAVMRPARNGPAVNHHIDVVFEVIPDERRIMEHGPIRQFGAGRNDGVPQRFHQSEANGAVGHTDTHRLALGQHDLWHQPGALQDKGVRSRQQAPHGFGGIVGRLGVKADVLQSRAYETKRFFLAALP